MANDGDTNRPSIVEQNGINVVRRAMQRHESDAKVQLYACETLEVLSRNNEEADSTAHW